MPKSVAPAQAECFDRQLVTGTEYFPSRRPVLISSMTLVLEPLQTQRRAFGRSRFTYQVFANYTVQWTIHSLL